MTKQNTGKGLAVHATLQRMGAQRTFHCRCATAGRARGAPGNPFAVLRKAYRSFMAKGFYPMRHEDLHARGPRMKINQPKCMCRASQGKGSMRGMCADAKISLGDAFLYGP